MLPVSHDCLLLITPSVFSNVYLSCVLCTQCCQCLRIVYCWLHLRFSLTFICPVYCVPNVVSVSRLSIVDYTFGFLYRLIVLCVPNVASVSGLSILYYPFVFSNVYLSCVLCTQCCQCLRIVYCWLHLRFSLTFNCPVCTQCCQCLRIIHSLLHLRFSLTFICPVYCVPNVVSVSGLSIIDYTFGFL